MKDKPSTGSTGKTKHERLVEALRTHVPNELVVRFPDDEVFKVYYPNEEPPSNQMREEILGEAANFALEIARHHEDPIAELGYQVALLIDLAIIAARQEQALIILRGVEGAGGFSTANIASALASILLVSKMVADIEEQERVESASSPHSLSAFSIKH